MAHEGHCPPWPVVSEMIRSQEVASLYGVGHRVQGTAQSPDILVLILALTSRPSFFHCTRTRPGFSQSDGCILFTSCSVPRPRPEHASAMSLLSGHHTLLDRDIRRAPVRYGRFASI